MPRSARARHLAFPLAVACAVLAPLAFHWAGGRTLAWFDTLRLYAPQRWLVDEALRSFRLPLWNPFMGAGVPFLADAIHGVLHPVSVLTAWLGTGRSADLLIGGHVACAGLGAALLTRDLGASRAGAAAAAFTYGLSGFVLSMAGNLVFLAGAGSLPFCLAGLRRFAAAPGPATLAMGAAGAMVLALSGDAQALMVGGALSLALALEVGGWRGAARAVAAGLIGLLLAGVQLVPSAVHLPRTDRASGSWVPVPGVWAFEPWRLPELVLPGLAWGPDPLLDQVFEAMGGPGRWPAGGLPIPFAPSVAVGLVPVALALAGGVQSRRGRWLAGLALALLWGALGTRLGADAVLRQVPLWSAFRYAEKLVGPLSLLVGVLAGLGLDAVVERRRAAWLALGTAAALGLASVLASRLMAGGLPPEVAALAGARLLRGGWHVAGALLAFGGWVLLGERAGAQVSGGALAALVWASAVAASPAALRPGDPAIRLTSPGPALTAAPPGPRILTPYTYEPLARDPGLDWTDQQGREHAALGYPAHHVRHRLDSLADYGAMRPGRLARLQAALWPTWPREARRYGATHVVVAPPTTEDQRFLHDLATRGATRTPLAAGPGEVWSIPHRAWASFPEALRPVADEAAAIRETVQTPFEAAGVVVLETRGRPSAAPGRVLSVERGLESLRVEAETAGDATLLIADAWWPGWEATIDGARASILPADVVLRAVPWPAGRHVLEMRYRPPEVAAGLLASALGLGLLLAWGARLRRGR
ncbi:MAG: hypothetical protein IPO09_00735 [Anaeromyxobacter sp.]|nr:hypothetical protein [Anaeromyxobacter sp.]